jgi:outer membrane protein assembly factor BamE (lipoprotein component of BamABCDE complex)
MRKFSQVCSLGLAVVLSLGFMGQSALADPGKTYSEQDFLKLVVGKSADEVRGALGDPQEIVPGKNDAEHWYYQGLVEIGKSGKRFAKTEVVMTGGRVNHLMNHGSMPAPTSAP